MPKYITWEPGRQRWTFQLRIPQPLRPAFGGRTTIRHHLGNVPEPVAAARGQQLADHYRALFKRHERPSRPNPRPESQVCTNFILDREIRKRFVATWRTQESQWLQARLTALHDATDETWEGLDRELVAGLAAARENLRRGRTDDLDDALSRIQTTLNLSIQGTPQDMAELAHDLNAARVDFLTHCLAVVRGDQSAYILSPAAEDQLPLLELWGTPALHIAEHWKERVVLSNKQLNPKTWDKYLSIAKDLHEILIRRPIEDLTLKDIRALKKRWTAAGNGSTTVDQKLRILLTMLKPFDKEKRMPDLFDALLTGVKTPRAKRLPFTDNQLRNFIQSAGNTKSVREDDLMLILLLALLGTRIEEIYNLRSSDFEETNGGWIVRFADKRQTGVGDARLKNEVSARRLPLRKGVSPVLDSWLEKRLSAGGYLFPNGSVNKYGIRSSSASQRLNRLLRRLHPEERRLVLQSTRSTANRVMRRANVDPRIRHRLLGHADITIHDRHYDHGELLDDTDLQKGADAIAAHIAALLEIS
jgi:integrase